MRLKLRPRQESRPSKDKVTVLSRYRHLFCKQNRARSLSHLLPDIPRKQVDHLGQSGRDKFFTRDESAGIAPGANHFGRAIEQSGEQRRGCTVDADDKQQRFAVKGLVSGATGDSFGSPVPLWFP